MTSTRHALVFTAPGAVEVIEEACPTPGPGEVLVATRVSAPSAGTELLAYRGQLPADLPLDETLPALAAASFRFPFRYGYASVGVVTALGAGVAPSWHGRRVFAFVPHASAFVAKINDLLPVPDDVPDAVAPLYASAETATNLVLDGGPQLGERVIVLGQGVVGLLLTAQLARFPLRALVAVEPHLHRAALARRFGASMAVSDLPAARLALHESGPGGADLSYEVSGNPAALDGAIALTGAEGRVVVGSFYGDKRAPVDLGGHFHRGRLQLVSSQVSHLAPRLGARWDRARRATEAWRLLARIDAEALVSHRVPFAEAPAAYRRLAGADPDLVQLLLVHNHDR